MEAPPVRSRTAAPIPARPAYGPCARRRAIGQAAKVRQEEDGPLGILVVDRCEDVLHLHLEAQFFPQFPGQARLGTFAGFQFATGELPLAREGSRRPAGDEYSVTPADDACGDDQRITVPAHTMTVPDPAIPLLPVRGHDCALAPLRLHPVSYPAPPSGRPRLLVPR